MVSRKPPAPAAQVSPQGEPPAQRGVAPFGDGLLEEEKAPRREAEQIRQQLQAGGTIIGRRHEPAE